MAHESRNLIRKQVELDWLVETYGDAGAPAGGSLVLEIELRSSQTVELRLTKVW